MKPISITRYTIITVAAFAICAMPMLAGAEGPAKDASHGGGQVMTFSSDDGLFIPGVGAMVVESDGKFVFQFVAPPENRDAAYREVDIKKGDVLVMFNGKRVKSVEQLHELMDAVEPGTEIKLGLKRGQDMMIAGFAKADGSEMGGMMMTVTEDVGPDGQPQKMMARTITMGGPEKGMVPLIEGGVGLEDRDGALVVGPTLKIDGIESTEVDLAEGDVVIAINGTNVSSGDQFSPVYDKVEAGGQITLTVKRGDKQFEVVFNKPQMHGMRMIKKSGN